MSDLSWLSEFHGFLLVDKAAGMTSQDVITRMQRLLIARSDGKLRKRDLPKMGHGGTLDPFATGLLVIAVGDGTRLARYLIDSEKSYDAEIEFGSKTASGDLTNEVVERTDCLPSEPAVREAAASFLDSYLQTPPMYSAKKIAGKPLYELARQGIEVDREPIHCRVLQLLVLKTFPESAGIRITSAKISSRVSSGTYIRTLAEDLAIRAGSLGHLRALRRTSTGKPGGMYCLGDAVTLETLEATLNWCELLAFIPFEACLVGKLPSVVITDTESQAIIHGLKNIISEIAPRLPLTETHVALYHREELRAVFVRKSEGWDFERVFHPRALERSQ